MACGEWMAADGVDGMLALLADSAAELQGCLAAGVRRMNCHAGIKNKIRKQ